MHNFSYGSRTIENERTVSLETNVAKVGNTFRSVARLLVLFCVFAVVDAIVHNLAQHAPVISFETLRTVEQGVCVMANDNLLRTVYFVYSHCFGAIVAISFYCIIALVWMLCNILQVPFCRVALSEQRDNKGVSISAVSVYQATYRYKVCFLS